LNDLNFYFLYFPEEHPKHLDQDEIIEILDEAKALEWYEAMVNANIDIFELSYEQSVSYFKRLENLEKIRRTNNPGPATLPVDDKKRVSVTSSVASLLRILSLLVYGVTIVTKPTITTRNYEGELKEYVFTSSTPFSTRKTKITKLYHPTTNHSLGSEPHCQP
jgi:hypothetical protein